MKRLTVLIAVLPLGAIIVLVASCTRKSPQPVSASQSEVDARALLKKAKEELKKDAQSAYWHNQAAVALAMSGDLPAARKEIDEAIRISPDDPLHHYGAATLSRQAGDIPGEILALSKALSLDSDNLGGHFALGDALERKGDFEKSLREFELCLEKLANAKKEPGGLVYYDSKRNAYTQGGFRENAAKRILILRDKVHSKPRSSTRGGSEQTPPPGGR